MQILILSMLGLSLLLLVISFFIKDPIKSLREDLDQLSIQHVQEMYKMKKKLKVLEEELMFGDGDLYQASQKESTGSIHAIIKNQVWTLASQGFPIEKIANQSSLSTSQVLQIINERDVDME